MIVNTITKPSGLTPLIVVTAPTGSTVTCDSIVGTEVSGTWTFKVAIGSHTIVATSQDTTKTKTETVVVDAVAVYPITIAYSRLPSGYQEYDYIQSDGNQVIDTGIGSSTSNVIDIAFSIEEADSWTGNAEIIGGGGTWANNNINVSYNFDSTTVHGFNARYLKSGSSANGIYGTGVQLHTRYDLHLEYPYTSTSITPSLSDITNTSTSISFDVEQTIGVFGYRRNGVYGEKSKIKLYSCEITKDNVQVREFVPCLNTSTNKFGLYDLVSDTFFGNNGSGDFSGGNPV